MGLGDCDCLERGEEVAEEAEEDDEREEVGP